MMTKIGTTFERGDRVWLHRDGWRSAVVMDEYVPGMYVVKLPSGEVVVPTSEMYSEPGRCQHCGLVPGNRP